MAERRIVDEDIFLFHALGDQVGFDDLVGGAGEHVVRTGQHPALHAEVVHQVVHSGDGLLVRGRAGVDDVARRFFAFVLHGVEEETVEFFKHWQHGLARNRGPTAENSGDLVLAQQLAGLFCKEGPVGGRVHHHGFQFFAQQAAFFVLLFNEHEHDVFQRCFADGHGAGERMQNAHLDGVFRGLCVQRTAQGDEHESQRRQRFLEHVEPPWNCLYVCT